MADVFVQVPPDSTGSKIDNTSLTVNAQTVFRQRGNISSPTDANGHAEVKAAQPALTDYGVCVRQVPLGLSTYHAVLATGTNAANIKASAGQVYAVRIFNAADYPIFVKLHDTAGVPTPGASVKETFSVQAGTHLVQPFEGGAGYTSGIGVSVTKFLPDGDVTPVNLNDGVVDVYDK